MADKKLSYEFVKGLFKYNPIFRLALGLCPALAVSSTLDNAIAMGAALTFVLLGSELVVSAFKNHIPHKIRIPGYIIIVATFVTIASLLMQAFSPVLNAALGIYVPLIVVNCIILGRVEAFSSRNSLKRSLFDALGIGTGFTLALMVISIFRELLGTMQLKFFGFTILSLPFEPAIIFILAPGALLVVGLLLGLFNHISKEVQE
ncbi:MAG: electron transport complex subunit RsxE [Nanoarchaeota archaeon]